MSSLADRPELIGFFSYSREDDEDSNGALSALRERIQRELRGQLGRSMKTFRLWQDKEAIASGTLWEAEIKTAAEQSVFFIPIITPTVVGSPYCRFELDSFLAREAALGRSDLVFPILYIKVPALDDSIQRENDPVLSIIAKRQYLDWRNFRHRDVTSTDVKEAVERFCAHICEALHRPWLPPEERQRKEEAETRRRAEEEQRRLEEERQRKTAVEVEQQRLEGEAAAQREAEEAARQAAAAEAERQRQERDAAATRETEEKARQEEQRKKDQDKRQSSDRQRDKIGSQPEAPVTTGVLMKWVRVALWLGGLILVVAMTQADRIREFVRDRYIAPARTDGRTQITIRAGDVASGNGFSSGDARRKPKAR